jgi:hypothetical protein
VYEVEITYLQLTGASLETYRTYVFNGISSIPHREVPTTVFDIRYSADFFYPNEIVFSYI